MDAIGLMASAMRAAQARLDTSASNLANVASDGFHKTLVRTRVARGGLVVEHVTDDRPGALRHTGRAFDLALAGPGSLFVRDAKGTVVATRGGAFERDAAGHLRDVRGRVLMGATSPVIVDAAATIGAHGAIEGLDGTRAQMRLSPGASVQSGFLESANVDAVGEMVAVLGAQRSFETAQKTLVALDTTRQKDADDVARIKA